jgi:hypothetical protein
MEARTAITPVFESGLLAIYLWKLFLDSLINLTIDQISDKSAKIHFIEVFFW